MKRRLVIVANRLPVSVVKRGKTLRYQPSVGGLATGVGSLIENDYEGLWIGWPGIAREKLTRDERTAMTDELAERNCRPVFLSQKDIDAYYHGFCNKTIWPLFHYFTQYTVYDKSMWQAYVRVNKIFRDAVLDEVREDDIVWVHDYQLLILPAMLRERAPELDIGFFLHIPFPSYEVFRLLPWRREILQGLLGADLIGFHTFDYGRHFLSGVRNRLGYDQSLGQINLGTRFVKVDTFPMGIDYDKYAAAPDLPEVRREIPRLSKKLGDVKVILSVDRLDYTKGILQRLESFEAFLDTYPQYKEKVVLVCVAVPSRTKVERYIELKHHIDERVGAINGKYGTIGWTPVQYMYTSLNFPALIALYRIADVALVTPVRDGMNLIAKEYIAAKGDAPGVLILSEMAGAAKELGEALTVNPNNSERIAQYLKAALTMPVKEQQKRNTAMQKRLKRYDIRVWADDFIRGLITLKDYERELLSRRLTPALRTTLMGSHRESTRRLFLLDYDGTLKDYENHPEDAVPDKAILRLLIALAKDERNVVYIISGRDKDTLATWFKHFPVGLVAEHGVWSKHRDGDWELSEQTSNYWKDEIHPVLEQFMIRTPGSSIEEKGYSLVWHYRNVTSELGEIRAREIKEALMSLTANLGLGVLEGNKVVEIKNAGINKGIAALKLMAESTYDFIFAAGDDRTDEDIFGILPRDAWSVKVGLPPSKARFTVESVKEIRALLTDMTQE